MKKIRCFGHVLLSLITILMVLPVQAAPQGVAATPVETAIPQAETEDYQIKLLAGAFTPEPGISTQDRAALATKSAEHGSERIHVLLQLTHIPDEAEKADWAARGVQLLEYVPNNAWIASAPANAVLKMIDTPGVRWLGD